MGSAPPDKPVPAPRGTSGRLNCRHAFSTAITCSSFSGSTTTGGVVRYKDNPSHSKGRVSSVLVRMQWSGTMPDKLLTNSAMAGGCGAGAGAAAPGSGPNGE